MVAAFKGNLALGNEAMDEFDTFAHPPGAFGPWDIEGLELLGAITLADAEFETAIGEDVDADGVLGDADGVVERHQEDKVADTDALGAHGNGGGGG